MTHVSNFQVPVEITFAQLPPTWSMLLVISLELSQPRRACYKMLENANYDIPFGASLQVKASSKVGCRNGESCGGTRKELFGKHKLAPIGCSRISMVANHARWVGWALWGSNAPLEGTFPLTSKLSIGATCTRKAALCFMLHNNQIFASLQDRDWLEREKWLFLR